LLKRFIQVLARKIAGTEELRNVGTYKILFGNLRRRAYWELR
jgi:hypothetical protein